MTDLSDYQIKVLELLGDVRERVSRLEAYHAVDAGLAKRVESLERSRSRLLGMCAAVSLALGLIADYVRGKLLG